ncbi:MAG: phosphoribosylformylglycinamidine synthase subunit PurL [Zetaproteobacteria bacterium]|nr:phosphoribosylformylglycinamidine synthase subunit PurL [Zetaproteobacteria bacterium]
MMQEPVNRAQTWSLKDDVLAQHSLSVEEGRNIATILARDPTLAELGVFSVMWSEHCSYKTSKKYLAKLPTQGKHVLIGPGENAGAVRIAPGCAVVFKMESHNHPSYIDPVQGAATGVGGILRDVFCMGARPIAVTNALRFGAPEHPKSRWLTHGVVKGISQYGNCVGIANIGGSVRYDERYNGNILVNAGAIGLAAEDKIFLGEAKHPGQHIYYVGAPTGRDGIHGAVMASDVFADGEDAERSAVQVGDPYYEKLLIEVTLQAIAEGVVSGLQDMGAAGLTSSILEMAARGGTGVHLSLEKVPTRAPGMSAYELLLSETQERMAMVVAPERAAELQRICAAWGLDCSPIGVVTDSNRFVATLDGVVEVDIPIPALDSFAPQADLPCTTYPRPTYEDYLKSEQRVQQQLQEVDLCEAWQHCSQMQVRTPSIYTCYDRHIGSMSVFGPEHGGAALLDLAQKPIDVEVEIPPGLGLAYAEASLEAPCQHQPYQGGAHAVAKVLRALACVGGEALGLTDCLNFGSPQDPDVLGAFREVTEGIAHACEQLDVPIVSGNVSLYNSTGTRHIPPTPMLGGVARVPNIHHARPAKLSSALEARLLWVRPAASQVSWGGTGIAEHYARAACSTQVLPPLDFVTEKAAHQLILNLLAEDFTLHAVKDVSFQGVLVNACTMLAEQDVIWQRDASLCREDFGWVPASYLCLCSSDTVASLRAWVQAAELGVAFEVVELGRVLPTPAGQSAAAQLGGEALLFQDFLSHQIDLLA